MHCNLNVAVSGSNSPVLAKYAGHVRQSFADVRQRALTLPDILSCSPARETRIVRHICWSSPTKMSSRGSKYPAGHWRRAGHFVWQTWNNFREDCSIQILSVFYFPCHGVSWLSFLAYWHCMVLVHFYKGQFLSPPVQVARWALMYRFLSVCSLSGLDQKL